MILDFIMIVQHNEKRLLNEPSELTIGVTSAFEKILTITAQLISAEVSSRVEIRHLEKPFGFVYRISVTAADVEMFNGDVMAEASLSFLMTLAKNYTQKQGRRAATEILKEYLSKLVVYNVNAIDESVYKDLVKWTLKIESKILQFPKLSLLIFRMMKLQTEKGGERTKGKIEAVNGVPGGGQYSLIEGGHPSEEIKVKAELVEPSFEVHNYQPVLTLDNKRGVLLLDLQDGNNKAMVYFADTLKQDLARRINRTLDVIQVKINVNSNVSGKYEAHELL